MTDTLHPIGHKHDGLNGTTWTDELGRRITLAHDEDGAVHIRPVVSHPSDPGPAVEGVTSGETGVGAATTHEQILAAVEGAWTVESESDEDGTRWSHDVIAEAVCNLLGIPVPAIEYDARKSSSPPGVTPTPVSVDLVRRVTALISERTQSSGDGSAVLIYATALQALVDLAEARGDTAPTVSAEAAEVAAERARQVDLGYTEEHDDAHGAYDLAAMAEGYIRRARSQGNRSDLIKAAAVLESAAASFRRLGHPMGTGEHR